MNTVPDDIFNAAVRRYKRSRRKNPTRGHADDRCVNLTADGKRCVASQILHDLGFRGGDLDRVNASTTPETMVACAEAQPYDLTDAQLQSLRAAQIRADQGREWWQALKGATV